MPAELSPTEHVDDVVDRLAADPHNAVITLDAERALAAGRRATEELATAGGGGRCTASRSG